MTLPRCRFVIALGLLAGLGACAAPAPPPQVVYLTQPTYCYISLADRECYRAPVPGQGYRLAGTRPTEPR